MNTRIDPSRLNSRKLHHDAAIYLLRLCADLKVLIDNKQPLRADVSRLEEWAKHRRDLEECESPVIRYSQYGQIKEGEMNKHMHLLMLANALVIELKLRNTGETVQAISWLDLEAIEREVMQLDCRQRLVFY